MDIAHIQKANEAELRSFEDRLATEEFQPKVELTFSSGNEWLVIAHYNSEVFRILGRAQHVADAMYNASVFVAAHT